MERISVQEMTDAVMRSGRHLWIATDVLYECGVRFNRNSRHPDYRRAMRVLKRLSHEGVLCERYIASVNLTVFWRIP